MKADFKNIFQASYKDSQMKLQKAILVIFFVMDFEQVFVFCCIFKSNYSNEFR